MRLTHALCILLLAPWACAPAPTEPPMQYSLLHSQKPPRRSTPPQVYRPELRRQLERAADLEEIAMDHVGLAARPGDFWLACRQLDGVATADDYRQMLLDPALPVRLIGFEGLAKNFPADTEAALLPHVRETQEFIYRPGGCEGGEFNEGLFAADQLVKYKIRDESKNLALAVKLYAWNRTGIVWNGNDWNEPVIRLLAKNEFHFDLPWLRAICPDATDAMLVAAVAHLRLPMTYNFQTNQRDYDHPDQPKERRKFLAACAENPALSREARAAAKSALEAEPGDR